MARGFESASGGVGNSDRIVQAVYSAVSLLDTLTLSWWQRRDNSTDFRTLFTLGSVPYLAIYKQNTNFDDRMIFYAGRWPTPLIYRSRPYGTSVFHVTVTYAHTNTSTAPTLYMNGSTSNWSGSGEGVAQAPSGTLLTTPATGNITIGNSNANNQAWQGRIWELCVWNRILSAGEVAAIYAGGPYRAAEGLVGYWPLYGGDSVEPNYGGYGGTATVTNAGGVLPHFGGGRWFGDMRGISGGATAAVSRSRSFVAGMIG